MSAPDKKYLKLGYVGPGYLDELMEMYINLSGRDVVFDRSAYGEFIWPEVYNRAPQLTEDDMEALIEIEEQNDTQRVILYDKNVDLHWKRCIANNEPMDRKQFSKARALFEKMGTSYNFGMKELTDFVSLDSVLKKSATQVEVSLPNKVEPSPFDANPLSKLELANAINSVLSTRVIRKKGDIFDDLESDVRLFLTDRLNVLLGGEAKSFTGTEVEILKLYCKRITEKVEGK